MKGFEYKCTQGQNKCYFVSKRINASLLHKFFYQLHKFIEVSIRTVCAITFTFRKAPQMFLFGLKEYHATTNKNTTPELLVQKVQDLVNNPITMFKQQIRRNYCTVCEIKPSDVNWITKKNS